jgi:hypothetical protein
VSATFFVNRYHVAALFTAGALVGMLLTCARETAPPLSPHDCEQAIIEPFLHRKPGDVTLGELRQLIEDLQRCSRKDTLFTDDTDLFGIGATGGELPGDGGLIRSAP